MSVTTDRLAGELGWGLAVLFRGYVKAADAVTDGLPGGHRGYQVLSAAARDEPGSQAALAARLGIDRTVMTYLLDDLAGAGLVERRPDPCDRRTRLVVATEHGRSILADLDKRFARAEQHILGGLSPGDQAAFRSLLATLATHVNSLDPVATACDAVADIGSRAATTTRQ
jgi:DNA-binding MarR family transcriptional regulator